MPSDTIIKLDDAAQPAPGGAEVDGSRDRSSIEFPYMPLGDVVELARAVQNTTGAGPCQYDQLAGALRQQPTSSTFRVKISAARTFGLIEVLRGTGTIKLTELGRAVVDPTQERQARAEAFLAVPLYKALYDAYRGKSLPPAPIALERELVRLGVAPKQADRARQALQRSAEQAGFFEVGNDRLVYPPVQNSVGIKAAGQEPVSQPPLEAHIKPGGGGGGSDLDPLIDALIKKLPKAGATWPVNDRVMWLRMAAMAFQMAYEGPPTTIEISASAP